MQVVLVSLALAVGLPASAGEEFATPIAAHDVASPRIVAVDSHPEVVVLDRRHASIQLLLSAWSEGGARLDVTRAAELVDSTAPVTVTPRGVIRPTGDGEGVLRFRVDSLELEVPVRVSGQGERRAPSFVQDVMPIISRAGCNSGACHGAEAGQNGFSLTLRGYDPEADHAALTDDLSARRFDRVRPDQSLFLLKLTGSIPHVGGRRLEPDSDDYAVLREWVAGGAGLRGEAPELVSIKLLPDTPTIPRAGMEQQVKVLATYADGSVSDVSAHAFIEVSDIEVTAVDDQGLVRALRRGETSVLARYEGNYDATRLYVMGDREGFSWEQAPENNYIDTLVHEKLRQVRVLPSGLCSDAEFLRRVRLDLTGIPPTPKEVRTFLLDERETNIKREELIDRLIGGAQFVEHWTNRWCDLLQVNSDFLGSEGAVAFREWVRGQVASNRPYDEFVTELLTATGSTYENPATAWHKVLREPDVAMEATTQLFLGVRFSCNKCHNHPFERWTQDQHWELAAFFAQVDRVGVSEGAMIPGEERIMDAGAGELTFPDSERVAEPRFPFEHAGAVAATAPRREQLASWVTSPENPYFATSYVNRLWSYLLGVGLIEPIDDLRASNPPSNPALLERLTREFVEGGFDVRGLLRTICRSRAYQRDLEQNDWNADDELNYAHGQARRLSAEVLFDALHQATGSRTHFEGVRAGTRASELVDSAVEAPDGFLGLFGRPPRESVCECERSSSVSLGQALNLVNGPTVAEAIGDPENEIASLVSSQEDAARIVEELYLSFLGRYPSASETDTLEGIFDPMDIENVAALTPEDAAELGQRLVAWEAARPPVPDWSAASPGELSHASGASELVISPDGALFLEGEGAERETLTVAFATSLEDITGLRLEVLPHGSLPAQGPGRAENGNFVLSELSATVVPLHAPEQARALEFSSATADFSQKDYDISAAIDGKLDTGWAVSPRTSERHEAVFEVAEGPAIEGGYLVLVRLRQEYGAQHTLGHLRLSLTESPRPVRHHGLAEPVLAALQVPRDERSAAEAAVLHAHFMPSQADLAAKMRLGAAQDLAWALANSPAFLFNR